MEIYSFTGGTPINHSSIGPQGINGSSKKGKEDVISDLILSDTANLQSVQTIEEMKKLKLQGEKITVSDAQLIKAIEKAIKAVQGPETTLQFSIHEQTKQIMVKVMEKQTGKLIREVPPEKTLDFVASIWKMAGILIDEKR
ncbi:MULTISPECIES: flagellar protein FlaG [unclassified Paenibacillus]|uniref:flagellar protein FlaG n=1 Tax=unclassified Paenibacillus TaxID=185978 RepID=UPI001AE113A1|nr:MULTISPECIES: flagellar protein FlaG [unclassified Paenibacillus]MBP1157788.1 flagellar protein FlaG [Paenibacillus sp. PvP091]MBP1171476.1 flagellar protein FlaG [Paenibacillus sp. PvR098]MBP2442504.1 flagellar protein FlaG [Paenibacillus sp. PvP052]